jgi:hypothetical protein
LARVSYYYIGNLAMVLFYNKENLAKDSYNNIGNLARVLYYMRNLARILYYNIPVPVGREFG